MVDATRRDETRSEASSAACADKTVKRPAVDSYAWCEEAEREMSDEWNVMMMILRGMCGDTLLSVALRSVVRHEETIALGRRA